MNPFAFPILSYPGPAPELAARSGQGGWEAYAQPAPPDRLLPFVLTRLSTPGSGRWVNCANIVHADTGALLETLVPTGQLTPPMLGLALHRVVDAVNLREHFIYTGALIPGLSLPCGVPLRLLLDNAWQSPRFVAVPALAGAQTGANAFWQRLEWHHPGPLSGVPYGSGLVQRLFVENGGLQPADPRQVESSSQDATTGSVRQDALAIYERLTATAGPPVPRYLLTALQGARAHKTFTVDGKPYALAEVKATAAGGDGGRSLVTLTLEALEPLQSRLACPAAPLPVVPYDPDRDAPRGWYCGDASDTAPDYQPTGTSSCELSNGSKTGYLLEDTQDKNRYSPTFEQAGPVRRTYNPAACPLPAVAYSDYYTESATRNDCPSGQVGSSVAFESAAGKFSAEDKAGANAKAVAYVQAGKQANANQYGTCTPSGGGGGGGAAVYIPVYFDNASDYYGCFACTMVNNQDATDVRQATPEEIQQYSRARGYSGQQCELCAN